MQEFINKASSFYGTVLQELLVVCVSTFWTSYWFFYIHLNFDAAVSLSSSNTIRFSFLDSGRLGLLHYHAQVVCLGVPVWSAHTHRMIHIEVQERPIQLSIGLFFSLYARGLSGLWLVCGFML